MNDTAPEPDEVFHCPLCGRQMDAESDAHVQQLRELHDMAKSVVLAGIGLMLGLESSGSLLAGAMHHTLSNMFKQTGPVPPELRDAIRKLRRK